MKTTIIAGMLGAGKTTFIQNYLKNIDVRSVVLVNDFGKAGIDGEILSQVKSDTIELSSGCVCCTLRFDLLTTLKRIKDDLKPDYLLIEPSGIASPSAVLEALHESGINRYTVVTVVDPTEFIDIHNKSEMYGAFFLDQIKNGDIILINKTDIAESEAIERTRSIIVDLNPIAVVLETVYSRLDIPINNSIHVYPNKIEKNHINLKTLTLNVNGNVSYNRVKELFHGIYSGDFGNIIRAKALVNTDAGPYKFDYSARRVNMERFTSDISSSRIVIIGMNIKTQALESFF